MIDDLDLTTMPLVWQHTGDAELPYTTHARNRRCVIRINDFPAEPLYTLMVDGQAVCDLEDWPSAWVMPAPPKELLDLVRPKGSA
jgi:hypothetical protein